MTVTDAVAIRALLDKQAIYEQLLRYARAVDRRDLALLETVFHADAIADYGDRMMSGASIAADILRTAAAMRDSQHLIVNVLIDLADECANSEAYFVVSATVDHAGAPHTRLRAGRYIDRFQCRDGDWRISNRVVADDWSRLDRLDERPAGTTHGS